MLNADGDVVGIRLRTDCEFKYSIRGGRQGLFVPEGIAGIEPLLIAEGPSDTAALLDLGFAAVGRPSCNGGGSLLRKYVSRYDIKQVVIVADRDSAGVHGAESLLEILVPFVLSARIILPPEGVKDARAWKNGGATAADVTAAIEAATPSVCEIKLMARKRSGGYHG